MAEAVWKSAPAGKRQDDVLGGEKTSPVSPVSGSHQQSVASKMSPPKDSYWFAQTAETVGKVRQVPKASLVEKDESPTQEQFSPSHKPYMDKQCDLQVEGISPVERLYVPPRAATPNRLDSYWFAHSGIDLSSPTADQASDSGYSDGKESSPPSLQKEKKSHQEHDQYFEGRKKQQKQLRTFTAQTDAFHECDSGYRQPKAEHYHDQLRYSASEEKRSYIWDTKMESKDETLKQGFDQKAKIEARRNAQRNHLSFAFGKSTQDNLEDRTSISSHPSYQGSEVIFPIIRHVDELDSHGDKRNDMSSYNLIQKIGYSSNVHSDLQHCEKKLGKRKAYAFSSSQTKECLTWSDNNSLSESSKDNDCMSRSMIITSTTCGRKKTDLLPVMPLNRSTFSRMPSPGNQAKRSVSMTRLDQLAQPRRHYVEARQEMGKNASSSGSPSFAASMTVRKEPSHSPSRPRSSLSAAAEAIPEKSQTLKVTMRPKPKSRPRPVSIAGTIPDQPVKASAPINKDQAKPHKRPEKKGPGTSAKPPSLKTATSPAVSKVSSTQKVPGTHAEKEAKDVEENVMPEPEPPKLVSSQTEMADEALLVESILESNKEDEMSTSITKSRIISEEEAKAALQEKRRLAREQAEREAELERIRQEEIRRQEEEQRRKEEEELRRQEEEQLRLMEELQRQEEEKLRKAIEEKQKREEEERLRQEEENKLKAEKEEQERIAREEAERQRLELEERLRREEEERAERKRRVEQIMSRTRGKAGSNQGSDVSDKGQISNKPSETAAKLSASGHLPSSVLSALSSIHGGSLIKGKNDGASDNNNLVLKTDDKTEETEDNEQQSVVYKGSKGETELPQNTMQADAVRSQEDNIKNMSGDQGVTMVISNVKESERKLSCDKPGNIEIHHQTNGYETERNDTGLSQEISEETTNYTNIIKAVQPSPGKEAIDSNLEQVIQLEDSTTGKSTVPVDDNLLNNVEDMNSNTVPGTPVVAFEEVRQPQASITG